MKTKITILLTALLFSCIISLNGQQIEKSKYDIDRDNYYEWSTWTYQQKQFYVLGFISGAYAMGSEIAYNSNYVDLLTMVEDTFPTFQVREYIVAVDWIYETKEVQKLPAWVILIRLPFFLEQRREIERRSLK